MQRTTSGRFLLGSLQPHMAEGAPLPGSRGCPPAPASTQAGLPPQPTPQSEQILPVTSRPAGDHDERRGTLILERFEAQHQDEESGFSHAVHDRTAAALRAAKARGLASPGMIAHATAAPGLNQYAVSELPTSIQLGFRLKMLTLLLVQLVCTLSLSFLLRFGVSLSSNLTGEQAVRGVAYGCLFAAVVALLLLNGYKQKHPLNLALVGLFSVCFAAFVATSDLPGGLFRSHALLLLMTEVATGVFLLVPLSQVPWGAKPLSLHRAGLISYGLWLTGAGIIYGILEPNALGNIEPGHFVSVTIGVSLLFVWVFYDAHVITCKASPDEYLMTIIYFYTDLFYTCICCCLLACAASTGGNVD